MSLADLVRRAGVVGAGGGGFPTHVKLAGKAEYVIANGAECEPLLHKDAILLEHHAPEVVDGLRLIMEAVGAQHAVIGIKAKKHEAIAALETAIKGTSVRLHLLKDYYPAGDEFDLVYEVTGRLIPPGGLPLQVGAVVQNIETLLNISRAAGGKPVTEKTLTIGGAVANPGTFTAPVGTPFAELLQQVGGNAQGNVFFIGGVMMGEMLDHPDFPVTKTTTGVIVLPKTHLLATRKAQPEPVKARIGKSACDQCRYCTEFCPRYLLGYLVEPHAVMRNLLFGGLGHGAWSEFAAYCCACGLCTLFACPEQLFPKEACDTAKLEMRKAGVKPVQPTPRDVHPLREGRRVSIGTLVRRLALGSYDREAPFRSLNLQNRRLILPLRQGAGVAGQPLARPGDAVRAGQPLTKIPDAALGSIMHAPKDGRVETVTSAEITLQLA